MSPRYRITLTAQERIELEAVTRSGKTLARRYVHARALLLCDAGPEGPAWSSAHAAAALGVTGRTIEHLKKRFVEQGMNAALARKQRKIPPRKIIYDDEFEAKLITLAYSKAPDGHQRWTIRLLAESIVDLNIVPNISHMTIFRILKKRKLNLSPTNIVKYRYNNFHNI